MLTTDELMRPRYKVIADYPGTQYSTGDILPVVGTEQYVKARIEHLSSYPHLFQQLPWYADRKPEDMPEYLEWDNGVVCKPSGYKGDYFYLEDDENFGYHIKHVSIATLADYEQYNQQKEGMK
jgi:hypothetical protein